MQDVSTIVAVVVIVLLALSWHEAAHAWVADRLGDPTARQLGRVTLNPLKHLDPWLSLGLPVLMYMTVGFAVGGGKPVPIDPRYFRHQTRDFMLVALAGPFSNLLLAILFSVLLVVGLWTGWIPMATVENPYGADVEYAPSMTGVASDPPSPLFLWLQLGVLLNVLLAAFNLIPIPPLDGSRVIGWLLPRFAQRSWYRLDRVGILLVIAFLFLFDGFTYIQIGIEAILSVYDEGFTWLLRALDVAP